MTEEQKNNTENCDQFTKPEEISALKKYLRALKEDLEERTELETESQMMDPSYREEKAHLDTSREKLMGGENPLLNLPGTKETIDVEKLSRLDQMRVRLEGNNDSLESLSSSIDKIQFLSGEESLTNELIKISGENKESDSLSNNVEKIGGNKESNSLSNNVEKIGGNTKESQKLSSTVEKISAVEKNPTLSDSVEKLNKKTDSEILSNSLEKIRGEKKSDSLSKSIENLKLSGEENVLSEEVDRLSGEEKKVVLTNDLDKIGGVKEKTVLSSEVDKIKNPLEEITLSNTLDKVLKDEKETELGKSLERIHDPFKKPEKLSQTLETVDFKPSGKVDLSSYLDNIIKSEDQTPQKLSSDLEKVDNVENSFNELPKNKEFIENPPKEQSLGKRILNKIRGVEKIDKLNGDKEIVRGTIQETQLNSFLDSPIEMSQNDEVNLSDTLDTIDIPKKDASLGEERQEVPFRHEVEEELSRYRESIKADKGSSLEENKEIIPNTKKSDLELENKISKEGTIENSKQVELDKFLDKSGKLIDTGVKDLDSFVDKPIGDTIDPPLDAASPDFPKGDKKLNLSLGDERVDLNNVDSDIELDKNKISYVIDDSESKLDKSVDSLDIPDSGINSLETVLDGITNVDDDSLTLGLTLDKLRESSEEVSLSDVLDKLDDSEEDLDLDNVLDKIDVDEKTTILPTNLSKDEILNNPREDQLSDEIDKLSLGENPLDLSSYVDSPVESSVQEPEHLRNALESDGHFISDQNPLTDSKIYFDEDGLKYELQEDGYTIYDQKSDTTRKIYFGEEGLLYELQSDGYIVYDQNAGTEEKIFFSEEGLVQSLKDSGFVLNDQYSQSDSKIYLNKEGFVVEIQKDGYIVYDQNSETVEKYEFAEKGLKELLVRDGYILPDQEPNADQKIFYTKEGLRYELQKDGYTIYDQAAGTEEKVLFSEEGLRDTLPEDGYPKKDQDSNTEEKNYLKDEGLRDTLLKDGHAIKDQDSNTEEKFFYTKEGLRYELLDDGYVIYDQETDTEEKIYFSEEGLRDFILSDGKTISDQDPYTLEKLFFHYEGRLRRDRGLRKRLTRLGYIRKDRLPFTEEKDFLNDEKHGGLRKDLSLQGKPGSDKDFNTEEKRYFRREGLIDTLVPDGELEEDRYLTAQKHQVNEKNRLEDSLEKDGLLQSDQDPNTEEKLYLDDNGLNDRGLRKVLPEGGTLLIDLINSVEKSYLEEKGFKTKLNKDGFIEKDSIRTEEKYRLETEKILGDSIPGDGTVISDQRPDTDPKKILNYEISLNDKGLTSSLEKYGKPREDDETTEEKRKYKVNGLSEILPKLGKRSGDRNSTKEKHKLQKGLFRKEFLPEALVLRDQNSHTDLKELLKNSRLPKKLSKDEKVLVDQEPKTREKYILREEGLEKKLRETEKSIKDQNLDTPDKNKLARDELTQEISWDGYIIDQSENSPIKIDLKSGRLRDELDPTGKSISDQNSNTPEKEYFNYEGNGRGLRKELSKEGKIIADQDSNTPEKEFLNYEGRYHDKGLKKKLPEDGYTLKDQEIETQEKRRLKEEGLAKELTSQELSIEDQDSGTEEKKYLRNTGLKTELETDGLITEDQLSDEKQKSQLRHGHLESNLKSDGYILSDQNSNTDQKNFFERDGLRSELELDGHVLEDQNQPSPIKTDLDSGKLRENLETDGLVLEDQSQPSSIKTDLNSGKLRNELELDGLVLEDQSDPSSIKNDLNSGKLRDELESDGIVGEDYTTSPIKDDLNSGKLRDELELDGLIEEDHTTSSIKDDFNSGILRDELASDGLIERDHTSSSIKDDLNSGILRDSLEEDGKTIQTNPEGDAVAIAFDDLARDSESLDEGSSKSLYDELILKRAEEQKQYIRSDQNPDTKIKEDLYERDQLRDYLETGGLIEQDHTTSSIKDDLNSGILRDSLEEDGKTEVDHITSAIKDDLNSGILRDSLEEDGKTVPTAGPEKPQINQLAVILDDLARGAYGELSESQLKSLYDFFLDFRGEAAKERVREDQIRYSVDGTIGKQFDPDHEPLPDAVLGVRRGEVYDKDGNVLDDPDKVESLRHTLEDDGKTVRTVGPEKPGIDQLAVILDDLVRNGDLSVGGLKELFNELLLKRAQQDYQGTISDQNPNTDAKDRLRNEENRDFPLTDLPLEEDGKIRPTIGTDKPQIDPLAVTLDNYARDNGSLTDEQAEQLYNNLLLTRAEQTRDELGRTLGMDKPGVDPLAIILDNFIRDSENFSEEELENLFNYWIQNRANSEISGIPIIDGDADSVAITLDNLRRGKTPLTEEQAKEVFEDLLVKRAEEQIKTGGKLPKSLAPRTEYSVKGPVAGQRSDKTRDYDYYFDPDSEKDLEVLTNAFKARAEHHVQKYSSYLLNYASSKDLGGWGQKLQSLLSKFTSSDLSATQVTRIEEDIKNLAKEYYKGEGKIYTTYSHMPGDLSAMLNANDYLRFIADEVRRGYNALNTKGQFWRTLDNFTGMKEHSVDMILWALIKARDMRDEVLKINRSRLPDSNVTQFSKSAEGDILDNARGLLASTVENATINLNAYFNDGRYVSKPDKSKPFNRPKKRDAEDPWKAQDIYTKTVTDFINERFEKKERPTPPGNDWRNTLGWTDPNMRISKEIDTSNLANKDGTVNLKSILKRSFVEAFNPDVKADLNSEINYFFKDQYMRGTGMWTTLEELTDSGYSEETIMTPSTFNQAIIDSSLMSHPGKYTKFRSLVDDMDDGTVWTLDSNSYWEVTIEPYLGWDNGYCSYLPSVEEMNAKNWIQHNVITSYNRWFPVVDFDLSRAKMNMKSLGIYDGEINFPGGIEFTNELRLTLVDDSYKSFRQFFEKSMYVSVYSSEIHKSQYYGYDNSEKFLGIQETFPDGLFTVENCKIDGKDGSYTIFNARGNKRINDVSYKVSPEIFDRARMIGIPNPNMITAVDKTSPCLALYKNITFRIKIYVFTPQLSTINRYDLLCVLKDMSEERKGSIEGSGDELELSFSIVGENPNPRWDLDRSKFTQEEAAWKNSPPKEEKKPEEKQKKDKKKESQKKDQKKDQKKPSTKKPSKRDNQTKPKKKETNRYRDSSQKHGGTYRTPPRGKTSKGGLAMD